MALHSGTRRPRNPAVGDMITSLGWSNRFAVAAYDCTSYRHLPAACSGWDGCHHNWGCTGRAPSQFAPSPGWDIWHQCNLSCVPAFHRVGGWGVRPATRFVRYHFNNAVFPAASRSLTVFSGHLGRHAFQPCQGRAGRLVSPVAGVMSPSGLLPPLPVLCWPSGWGRLSQIGFCL